MNESAIEIFLKGICIGAMALLAFQVALGYLLFKWRRDDEKFEATRNADLSEREAAVHADDCRESGRTDG